MANFCLSCYEIYTDTINEIKCLPYGDHDTRVCPKKDCYGKVIEVDELMLPTIMTLNKKGYESEYCCSGHIIEDNVDTYISFKMDEFPTDISLPLGFVLEDDEYYKLNYSSAKKPKGSVCIRKRHKDKQSQVEKYKEVFSSNINLLKWAKKLPNYIKGDK